MEVSGDGNTAYIAGVENGPGGVEKPKVLAVTFDKLLRYISSCDLTSLDYRRVNRMKRIKGEETLVLGCNKHFSLVENTDGSMREIGKVANVHSSDIVDFEMYDRFLYSRGEGETDVKVTEFGFKKVQAPVQSIPIPPPKKEILSNDPKPMIFKQSKYETFKRFKIDCSFISESFEKVAVAAKGNRVYAGGKGLHIFEKDAVDESKYKVLEFEGNNQKRFFAMKAARSGHVICQEATTNDMVVMDNTGEEQNRSKGA